MRALQDYIATIKQNSFKITNDFGIKTLRIFGSVSRNRNPESIPVSRLKRILGKSIPLFSGRNPHT